MNLGVPGLLLALSPEGGVTGKVPGYVHEDSRG